MKTYNFTIQGNKYTVQIKSFEDNIADMEVNGTPYQVELEKTMVTSKTPKLVRPEGPSSVPPKDLKVKTGLSKILAPLPGTIIKINIKEGDTVKKGDTVLIMEAMKMENNIQVEKEGTVKNLACKEGDTVLQGDLLIEIE
ncbi:MAG: biotin/lipoyl-binding protein [Cyclobacteriaceae bacterium]|nr:biotin/lipoyl-binding protein [Cyclobacteriaceae bacterium]